MSWKQLAFADEVASLSDNAPADVTKAAAAAGSGTAASRDDHKHDISTGLPTTIGEGDTQAEGVATSLARSDHQHQSPSTFTPSTHEATHKSGGGDEILLNEFGDPTGSIEINKQALVNPVIDPQATSIPWPNSTQLRLE